MRGWWRLGCGRLERVVDLSVSSLDARRVGGRWGAGQRLRSGAFAPDCPVVIFVAAYGGCLQIPSGLSTPRAPPATNPPGSVERNFSVAGEGGVLRVLLHGGGGGRFCGARSRPAARAAFGSLRVVLRRGFWRFACGGVVHVNPFDVCLYDGLRAMHVPVLMPDLPRFTHPTIAGRRVAIEVSGGGVFVGWVECVPIGLSTRMYAARNGSVINFVFGA